jgi:hypothetical protein
LQVTPQISKAVEAQALGRCASGCRGCGCNGGPGFRGPPPGRSNPDGDCVGFQDINRVCGPPPHDGCRRECVQVVPICLGYGRAWLVTNASALKLTLSWLPPVETQKRDEPADTPPRVAENASGANSARRARIAQSESSVSENPDAALRLTSTEFVCGAKRTCKEMVSCDEAMFHYKQCGLSGLDRTKNGVPCKSLCAR